MKKNVSHVLIFLALTIFWTCTQQEQDVAVSSVTISQPTAEMIVGETVKLSATITPSNATDKDVIWASSKQSVATVDKSGVVTAIAEGASNITASAGGKVGTCVVTVSKKVIVVSSIELNKTELALVEEEEFTLVATVKPDDATDKTVSWSSSDPSVATVAEGKVKALKEGTATITAKAGDKSSACLVTIAKKVIAVESISLNKETLSLTKGQSETLIATVKPDDATDKTVTWTTSNSNTVSVDNGKVTAVGGGRATITAKAGEVEATCEVTVTVPVSSVTLDKNTLSLVEGEESTLNATVKPDDATDKTVIWTSSNSKIATVENGKVKALKEGSVTITAKAGEKSATCSVTVSKKVVPVSSVSLSQTSLALVEGDETTLTATVKPDDATDKTVSWTSNKTDVVSVDQNGKVKALKEGSATITAKAGDKSATCAVSVSKKVIPVSSVSLDRYSVSLEEGQTTKLIATVSPADATDKSVKWESSNTGVATVSQDGTVKAIKEGEAKITASAGEKAATCSVSVSKKVIPVTSVTLNKSSLNLTKGQTEKLIATVNPSNATDKEVSWSTSNNTIVSIQQDGTITAIKSGSATITAKAGEQSATCSVTVSTPVESVSLDRTSVSLEEGQTTTLVATISPNDADDKTVSWSSSNTAIATVDNAGVVKAIHEGTATIKVSIKDKQASCVVTVSKKVIPVTSVSISNTSLSLKKGETATLTATISPTDATDKTITWSSTDATIASVTEKGIVTALKSGTATITAKAGEKRATCSVTVSTPVESVSLNKTSISLEEGETTSLVATIAPNDADEKTISWSSSNSAIANVDNSGLVKAIGEGEAKITASVGGKSAYCTVSVSKKVIPVTSIYLSESSISLIKGESKKLIATVSPSNTTETVAWTSSNTKIATVDQSGNVTAIGGGEATITATAGDKSAKCSVSVTVPVSGISLNMESAAMSINETIELIATVTPSDATDKTVTWLSSDTRIATVNNGVVTSLRSGKADITASAGSYSKTCKITVTAPAVTFNDSNLKAYLVSIYDSNNDNQIDVSEAKDIESINCPGRSITDLTGLEYCTNLNYLNVSGNNLSVIEMPYFNKLETIIAYNNPIERLNIKNDPSLTGLYLLGANTNAINGSTISLDGYSLSSNLSIAFPGTNYSSLKITNSPQLKNLVVSENTHMTSLVVTGNPQISTIDVSALSKLQTLDISNCGITALNVNNNHELISLDCSTNQISTLSLSNNSYLENLNISSNQLSSIRIADNPRLVSVQAQNNSLGSINTNSNTHLKELNVEGNTEITVLTLTNNTALETLVASKTALSNINISSNASLKTLLLADCTNIYNVDLRGGTGLEDVDVSGTSISSIDLTTSTSLKTLNVNNALNLTTLKFIEGIKIYANFAMGRCIEVNGVKGIVLYSGAGITGIISLDESQQDWGYKGETEKGRSVGKKTGAVNQDYGDRNTAVIKSGSPAAQWCLQKGEQWYLPAKNELTRMMTYYHKLNQALEECGGQAFKNGTGHWYWSSTEKESKESGWYHLLYCTETVIFSDYYQKPESAPSLRDEKYYVRAMRKL